AYCAPRRVGGEGGGDAAVLRRAAILYAPGVGKASTRATREMGEAAAAAATDKAVAEGAVGAGTGATVGKLLGMRQAMKSGVGSFTVGPPGGVMVSALGAGNAGGGVRDPASRRVGCRATG